MHSTAFFELYKICILLHRCNLKIFAKNRFEKSAIFVKIQQKFCKCRKICKFQKFQLENLVDFEKCCKTHMYLQKSEPIQPRTSNILPKFCGSAVVLDGAEALAVNAVAVEAPVEKASKSGPRAPLLASQRTALPYRRRIEIYPKKCGNCLARFRLYRHRCFANQYTDAKRLKSYFIILRRSS